MADLASFFVRLGTTFDGSGLNQAQASFKATGNAADKLSGGLGSIAASVAGGAAIWKLVEFSMASVEAFGEQERAERRLELAMQNLGVYTRRAHADLVAFADAQQKATTFQDDAIIETQALLTSYGLYGEQLKKVALGAMDLAAAKQIDLSTAANILGKAFQGTTGRLEQFGIKIKDTGNVADNFAQVMTIVQSKFGGAAAAETETYLGKVKQLSNNFGELKEKVGKELMPVAEAWMSWMNKAIDKTNELVEGPQQKLTQSRDKELVSIRAHIQSIKDEMEQQGQGTVKYALLEKELARAAEGYRILGDAKRKAAGGAGPVQEAAAAQEPNRRPNLFTDEEEKSREKTSQEARRMIEEAEFSEAEFSERSKLRKIDEVEFKLQQEGKYSQAALLHGTARQKAEDALNKKRIVNVADTLGTISTLSTSSNKTLAAIGKAAALSQATIDTYLGVGKAWALGPIIGPPLAALVLVAGLANVAKIAGVPLKKGGVAHSTPGGIMANIAEGGEDEAVTPLNEAAGRKLGIRPGMGGNTLVMHQTNYFGQAGGGDGPAGQGVEQLAEEMRLATRRGVGELLDLSKEIYETGKARAGES